MSRKLFIGLGILLTFTLSIFIFNILYQNTLPKFIEEINNSAIGAILTAFITVLLLSQQSTNEEVRERNVKVFQEKSDKFNDFIGKLWGIWEDRQVTLEELNEIMKYLSKDIILYTRSETVNKILTYLNEIADQVKPDGISDKTDEVSKKIQKNIFSIINELAKEIGLGGEIKPEIEMKLNNLENKIVPYLIQKDFKTMFINSFKETINNSEEEIDILNINYDKKFLMCQIKDSPVFIRIGPLEREQKQRALLGFYVPFYQNRSFQKYRNRIRGWSKDFLKNSIVGYGPEEIINFNNYDMVKKNYTELSSKSDNLPQNELALKLIQHYKTWNISGKNIENIIDECLPKKEI